jgi:hypothetical protein
MFKSPQPLFAKGGWGDFVDEINAEVKRKGHDDLCHFWDLDLFYYDRAPHCRFHGLDGSDLFCGSG